MKITIECEPRNGYTNISMFGQSGVHDDWTELNSIQDNSLDEISTYNAVDLVCKNPSLLEKCLNNWYKKTKPNGILKISFVNPKALAIMIKKGQLTLEQIHQLVFRHGKLTGFISIDNIKEKLKNYGWNIDIIEIDEITVSIESTRK